MSAGLDHSPVRGRRAVRPHSPERPLHQRLALGHEFRAPAAILAAQRQTGGVAGAVALHGLSDRGQRLCLAV
jgi:hypothetical protein